MMKSGQKEEDRPRLKVEDRRHWARPETEEEETGEEIPSTRPTIVDEYRRRAEEAERKLQEYIAAFKEAQEEQERVRERLARDVERKVEMGFAALTGELLDSVDDLDLALEHARGNPDSEPLARGVELARDRFLAALERAGVVRVDPVGEPFDPNIAEAVRVDPVEDPERANIVVETLRPGYRMGERLVRPARVAVGRHTPTP